jgi:hypothetical protein
MDPFVTFHRENERWRLVRCHRSCIHLCLLFGLCILQAAQTKQERGDRPSGKYGGNMVDSPRYERQGVGVPNRASPTNPTALVGFFWGGGGLGLVTPALTTTFEKY